MLVRASCAGLIGVLLVGGLAWPAIAAAVGPRDDLAPVPGGRFVMGDALGEPDEAPRSVVVAPFRLMRHEVTNAMFARFVAASGHRTDAERNGAGYVWNYSDDFDLSLSFTWDLADLAYHPEQVDVSVEARQLLKLRDDVLDELNQLYFERQRVLLELSTRSDLSAAERMQLRLRAAELAAGIDAWTGGWFSRSR